MVRNIWHIIQNIEKLKIGKIKKYRIFTQLELEILCDYLKNKNILHTIKIESVSTNYNFLYNDHVVKSYAYNTFFKQTGFNYERNKILNCFELYIQVYNGFVNLLEKKNLCQNSQNQIEKPQFSIYIWPTKSKHIHASETK